MVLLAGLLVVKICWLVPSYVLCHSTTSGTTSRTSSECLLVGAFFFLCNLVVLVLAELLVELLVVKVCWLVPLLFFAI